MFSLIKQEIKGGKYTSMSDAVLSKLRDWYQFEDIKKMVLALHKQSDTGSRNVPEPAAKKKR